MKLSDDDARTIARRVLRWPVAFQRSHFEKLSPETRRFVAEGVLYLNLRPEHATLKPERPSAPAQDPLFEPESAETTHADWHAARRSRELPLDAQRLRERLREGT